MNKKVERGACRQYIQLFASLRWSPPQRTAKCDHSGLALLKGSCLLARFRRHCCLKVDFSTLWVPQQPAADGSLEMAQGKCPGKRCRPLSFSKLWQCLCVYVCVGLILRESCIHHRNKRFADISSLRLRNDNNTAVTSPRLWGSRRKTSRQALSTSYPESKYQMLSEQSLEPTSEVMDRSIIGGAELS